MRNDSFLPRLNEKQNVERVIPASSGSQGKYIKYVSIPWPPLEVALSIFGSGSLVKNNF